MPLLYGIFHFKNHQEINLLNHIKKNSNLHLVYFMMHFFSFKKACSLFRNHKLSHLFLFSLVGSNKLWLLMFSSMKACSSLNNVKLSHVFLVFMITSVNLVHNAPVELPPAHAPHSTRSFPARALPPGSCCPPPRPC